MPIKGRQFRSDNIMGRCFFSLPLLSIDILKVPLTDLCILQTLKCTPSIENCFLQICLPNQLNEFQTSDNEAGTSSWGVVLHRVGQVKYSENRSILEYTPHSWLSFFFLFYIDSFVSFVVFFLEELMEPLEVKGHTTENHCPTTNSDF